jgi:tetratricopeptide (TPR) repeat protein
MMCRYLSSHKGLSLVKILLVLVILAGAALYFLPHVGGDTFTAINQIGDRVKGIVNNLKSKVTVLKNSLSNGLDSTSVKISRRLADLLDKLNLKKLSEQIKGVQDAWEQDMSTLLEASRNRGFRISETQRMYDEYSAGERSWRRVESFYWEDIQAQTQQAVQKSFENFLKRPIGCSDFSQELKTIWEIGERFNEDTFSGYAEAKTLSESLYNPRSVDFVAELFEWLRVGGLYAAPPGNWKDDWFIRQLITAIDTGEGMTPDYPTTIQMIETQVGNHPVYSILGDIAIAEIYLNYDLINSSIQHYEEAIAELSSIANQEDTRNPYSYSALGLHMALGLLHERMCSNADLASKEFKDVIAIARRLNLSCDQYNTAHYHLAVINLQIRERATIQPQFTENKTPTAVTAEELLKEQATPVPGSSGGVIKGTIGDGQASSRAITPSTESGDSREENPVETTGTTPVQPTPVPTVTPVPAATPTPADYYAPGEIVVGTIQPGQARRQERDIRLRPRQELGSSVRMERFRLEQLYNLSSIPEDAVREFELYLKCQSQGEGTVIARYVLNKYHGR